MHKKFKYYTPELTAEAQKRSLEVRQEQKIYKVEFIRFLAKKHNLDLSSILIKRILLNAFGKSISNVTIKEFSLLDSRRGPDQKSRDLKRFDFSNLEEDLKDFQLQLNIKAVTEELNEKRSDKKKLKL